MNDDTAVKVTDLHKDFVLPQHKNTSIKQTVVNIARKNGKTTQRVLDGISFEVKKGEFFGIVGRNGSGKSTLLKILAGVYSPGSGDIQINGGLTPFIELGVGFNPELSGRDNVFLNGALLGFTHKQMDVMYDDIVAFAELEPFMDQKLKNYSSGMQVRLAFSIAVKAENDILVFDEVLAVGDSNFQDKCIRQFRKLKKEGKTIILVSHSMDMIEKFCDRVLLVDKGKIVFEGSPSGAIDRYEALNMDAPSQPVKTQLNSIRDSEKKLQIESVYITTNNAKKTKIIDSNQDFRINLTLDATENLDDLFMAVRVCEAENQFPVIGVDSKQSDYNLDIRKGANSVSIKIENNPIVRGKYYIVAGIYESPSRKINYSHYNGMQNSNLFLVKGTKDAGVVSVDSDWSNEK